VPAVVAEVLAGLVAVRTFVRTPVPAVRTAVTPTALGRTATARTALTGAPPWQTGQRLRDGFGGILRGGVVRFGGHRSILHAT
jgi:hypothetical protein